MYLVAGLTTAPSPSDYGDHGVFFYSRKATQSPSHLSPIQFVAKQKREAVGVPWRKASADA